MDWTKKTDNPIDKAISNEMLDFMLSIRIIEQKGGPIDYVTKRIQGKSVLDIGVCEHSFEHIKSEGWKHRIIRDNCEYVLGIDILEELVKQLTNEGYNVKCIDATSDVDLGERFDVAYLGDIIEHVNNPVSLLSFSKRHLSNNGLIYVSTPNPLYKNNIRRIKEQGALIANFEHVAWITPTNALEIGRRAGLKLTAYVCFINRSRIYKNKFSRNPVSEIYTSDYLYIFIAD